MFAVGGVSLFMGEMRDGDCEKGKRGPDFLYIFQSSWVNVVLVYPKKSTLDFDLNLDSVKGQVTLLA